jgi:hypothetical protein
MWITDAINFFLLQLFILQVLKFGCLTFGFILLLLLEVCRLIFEQTGETMMHQYEQCIHMLVYLGIKRHV